MSILNVDKIQPIGSGSTVTVNATDTILTNAQAGVITATTFSGNLTGTINTAAQGNITSLGTLNGLIIDQNQDISMNSSVTGQLIVGGNGYTSGIALDTDAMHIYHNSSSRAMVFGTNETERVRITGAGLVGISTNAPSSALLDIATDAGSNDHLRLRRLSSDSNVATNWSLKPYAGNLYFREGGSSDKIYFDDSGDIVIMDGNLVVANGHGIDFSANTNDATGLSDETLDDYEEGLYIPSIVGSSGGSWTTATYRHMAYTKIGRLVHIQGYLQCDSETSPSGTLRIQLPFTVGNLTGDAENGAITVSMRAHGGSSNLYNVCGAVSSNYLEIIAIAGNGTHNWVDQNDVGTSWNIRIGGCYTAT